MEKKKFFCEECREDVDVAIIDVWLEGTLKGEKYRYQGREARCAACDSNIYVPEIQDNNLKALYDAYREKNGIISLEHILAIPKKYTIGKRPLSLLLGWGEQTFSRYCEGDMPTKQYSEVLLRIYEEPSYYAKILESNKQNLNTGISYAKSKKTLDALLGNGPEKGTKINYAIEYLLNQCQDITPLALQKALYYIQGFYYAFYETFLFHEDCEAWVHGPVYKDVYFKYRDYHFDAIEGTAEFDSSAFSSAEKAILDSVITNVCCYSGKILEGFTHAERPWLTARGDIPSDRASNCQIPKEVIGDYFCEVKDKYQMINPGDIKWYSRRMFEQI